VLDDSASALHRASALSAVRYAELDLPDQPRLAPWVVPVDLGDRRLQFRSAESAHTLTHPVLVGAFRHIEEFLDGEHTVEEITSLAGGELQSATVVFLLKLLHGNGLLQHGGSDPVPESSEDESWHRQVRFLSHFVPNASRAQSVLANAQIGVVGSAEMRQAIVSAFRSIGIDGITQLSEPATWLTESGAGPAGFDLVVACGVEPGFSFFAAVNRACLATRTRWLRLTVSGTSAQLGPTVVPYETACYTCLDLRRQTHEDELDGYLAYRDRAGEIDGVRDDGSAALSSVLCGQAALEVMRILVGHAPPATFGRYYEFSAASPVATPHDVLRVPRCASCSRAGFYAEAWDQPVLPTVQS
jgi:bacteriocin biosynthesis cyclodehydratase domain-containing protein